MKTWIARFFVSALAGLVWASAVHAQAAGEFDAAEETPLEVTIYPPGYDRRAEALEAFLDSEPYDAERHARLALPVAEDLARAGDFAGAQALLEETVERIREEGGAGTLALAAAETARGAIYEMQGELRKQVRHLKRARTAVEGALGREHPKYYRATLRIRNAELNLKHADATGPVHFETVGGELERIAERAAERFGPTHEIAVLAGLSRAIYEMSQVSRRSALARVERILAALETTETADPGLISVVLIVNARFHEARGDGEAAEAAVARLRETLPEDAPPIRLFEIADRSALDARAESERAYLMRMSRESTGTGTSSLAGSWADISFCVDASGRPQDVKVVGLGGPKSRSSELWAEQVAEIVRARRYAVRAPGEGEGACRPKLERLILDSPRINHAGSRTYTKSVDVHLVRRDLLDRGLDGGYLSERPERQSPRKPPS